MNFPAFDPRLWLYRSIIIVLIAGVVFFLCQQYVASEMKALQQAWQTEWRTQEQSLLRTLQDSNESLTVPRVAQLWLDRCTPEERRAYEALLQELGSGLSATELQQLANDFSRCGTTAADQSFAQAIAVERDVAALEQWFVARTFLPEIDTEYYEDRLAAWDALRDAAVDLQRAQYELDALQRELIVARQANAPVAGPRIQTLLQEVQAARETLSDATVAYRALLRELTL